MRTIGRSPDHVVGHHDACSAKSQRAIPVDPNWRSTVGGGRARLAEADSGGGRSVTIKAGAVGTEGTDSGSSAACASRHPMARRSTS